MWFSLIRSANAQEEADMAISAQEMAEMAAETEESLGFFGSIAAVWNSLVNEVVPAFRGLYIALRDFWWLLETFLAEYIGEPLLRLFNVDTYEQTNEEASGFIDQAGDSFWGFFIN